MLTNRFRQSSASSSSSSSAAGYLVLNEDLLSLFDQENDLRYLFFTAPISDYSSRYVEGRVFRREDFYDSSRGEGRNMGPCVPEMMLIQAECLARSGDYTEAIAVMLFYQIGELFQSYAVGKSRKNITELMDIRPDYANIEKDGK